MRLLVALSALCLFAPRIEAQPTAELQRLSVLIGTWDTEDVYRSISGTESRETGVRTCSFVMRDRYIECVTIGRNASGREREYRWLINYDTEARRYNLLGVFSNWPGKVQQTFRVDSTNTTWNIRSPSSIGDDGVEQWAWAQLVFSGRDSAVWTSYRNLETGPATEWSVSTRETWKRRAQ